jgi:hypothetical protein
LNQALELFQSGQIRADESCLAAVRSDGIHDRCSPVSISSMHNDGCSLKTKLFRYCLADPGGTTGDKGAQPFKR